MAGDHKGAVAPRRADGRRGGSRNVVSAPKRPWGLIAVAAVVVVFAAAVLTYALVRANGGDDVRASSPDQIDGVAAYDYVPGEHTYDPVQYQQSPPVGGLHDNSWADCTGTVYDVDIRHENAVHALEHGAVWITYNPDRATDADVATLADLVEGAAGLMLSPYVGLDGTISLQSWNHQLFVDSASDPRVEQFVDLMTLNPTYGPEVGAPCENPSFLADPPVAG